MDTKETLSLLLDEVELTRDQILEGTLSHEDVERRLKAILDEYREDTKED